MLDAAVCELDAHRPSLPALAQRLECGRALLAADGRWERIFHA